MRAIGGRRNGLPPTGQRRGGHCRSHLHRRQDRRAADPQAQPLEVVLQMPEAIAPYVDHDLRDRAGMVRADDLVEVFEMWGRLHDVLGCGVCDLTPSLLIDEGRRYLNGFATVRVSFIGVRQLSGQAVASI